MQVRSLLWLKQFALAGSDVITILLLLCCSSSQVSCSICMLGRYQAYLRLLVRSTAGRHNLQTFATSVVAEKKGYSINKIPLTELGEKLFRLRVCR